MPQKPAQKRAPSKKATQTDNDDFEVEIAAAPAAAKKGGRSKLELQMQQLLLSPLWQPRRGAAPTVILYQFYMMYNKYMNEVYLLTKI